MNQEQRAKILDQFRVVSTDENARTKPRIRCNAGEMAKATEEAFKLLVDEKDPFAAVYVRGQMLMRIVRYESKGRSQDGIKRAEGSTLLTPICHDWLIHHLSRQAEWFSIKRHPRKENADFEVKRDVPERIARNIIADSPWIGLPVLTGIINAPTILLDGRVIQEPGFDKESGLLFDPNSTKFPKVTENPTIEDALKALKVLKEPFKDFPFVDEVSRSVALSSAITALVRKSVCLAPMFVNDAPTPSSGKTLLASCPSYIATGHPPMMMAPNPDPESEKKALFSALLEGPSSIVIDNVEGEFGSSTLNAILTASEYTDRVLGASKQAKVLTNSLFMATGNNITIKGDLGARTLLCRIDPRVENPDARQFEKDLHRWIPENRGRLAVAALTIVKAYIAAGSPRPKGAVNYGRFDEWQRLCRFPLIWLGCADPCESREKIKASNPEVTELQNLLEAWFAVYRETSATINQALERCASPSATEDEKALLEAMRAVGEQGPTISARKVGKFLSSREHRIINGISFIKGEVSHRTQKWKIAAHDNPA